MRVPRKEQADRQDARLISLQYNQAAYTKINIYRTQRNRTVVMLKPRQEDARYEVPKRPNTPYKLNTTKGGMDSVLNRVLGGWAQD